MTESEIDEVRELIVKLVQSQLSDIQLLPESKRARVTKQFVNGVAQRMYQSGYAPKGAS
jgi:hypothetical protein